MSESMIVRAMQGKEQSSAATPGSRPGPVRAEAGSAADPPPPEDALLKELARLDWEMAGAQEAVPDTPAVVKMIGYWREATKRARDRIAEDAEELRRLAVYDKLSEGKPAGPTMHDAVDSIIRLENSLVAAEARAQGLRKDADYWRGIARDMASHVAASSLQKDAERIDYLETIIRDGSYASILSDIIAVCQHAYENIGPGRALRTAIDAALARPEPEGK